MNWSRIALAGVAAGVVMNIADFVIHGFIMAGTYMRFPTVFSQEEANPLSFLAISVCTGIVLALFFAKTWNCWGGGWKGGATFGFFVGLAAFFPTFYNHLVIADFPYFLSWCWGSIHVIVGVIGGAVLGVVYKSS